MPELEVTVSSLSIGVPTARVPLETSAPLGELTWSAAASRLPAQPMLAVPDIVQVELTSTSGSPVLVASSMQTWPSLWVTPPLKTRCGPERITQVPPDCLVAVPETVVVKAPSWKVPASTVSVVIVQLRAPVRMPPVIW